MGNSKRRRDGIGVEVELSSASLASCKAFDTLPCARFERVCVCEGGVVDLLDALLYFHDTRCRRGEK
jgi:hypothetical protein